MVLNGEVSGEASGSLTIDGGEGSVVLVTPKLYSGNNIVDITVDETTYHIYAPDPNNVEIDELLGTGVHIGTITIDDTPYKLYAPAPDSPTEVIVTPDFLTGLKIASITVNGDVADIYIPTPITASANSNIDTGTLIGSITINGVVTYFRCPDYSGDVSDLKTRMTAAEGNITSLSTRMGTAEGNITSLGNRMGTAEGNITNLQNRMGTAEGYITSFGTRITGAENDITGLKSVDNTLADDIAPSYDITATYSVGDYVMYQKELYKCVTAVETPETFDIDKWEAVNTGEELNEIKSSLSGFTGMKTLRATTPTTINTNVKIIDDSTLYGNWLTIGYMILYNNTYFMWLSDTSVKSLRIQADGLYINMGVSIGECPIWIILSKMPS